MKGNDYKNNEFKEKKTRNKQKSLLANLTVSGMLLTSSVVVPTTLLWEPKIAEASLVSAEILVMSKHQMILQQVLQRHIQILEIPTQSTLPSADRMR